MWFDILYHIGKRAQEGVHKYQKNSFGLGKTVAAKKYVFQKFNQVSKCSQGDESSASKCQKIDTENLMFEIGDDMCPYAYFCLYLNKLNEDLDALWQCPNLYCRKPESMRWYDKQKIREHTMCKWMMELSVQCGLSQKYTNHCIRKTCTTAMAKSGFQPHQIAAVTKYQSLESLKHYIKKPTIEDQADFSNALSKYGRKKKSTPHPDQEDTLPDIPSSPAQPPVI